MRTKHDVACEMSAFVIKWFLISFTISYLAGWHHPDWADTPPPRYCNKYN